MDEPSKGEDGCFGKHNLSALPINSPPYEFTDVPSVAHLSGDRLFAIYKVSSPTFRSMMRAAMCGGRESLSKALSIMRSGRGLTVPMLHENCALDLGRLVRKGLNMKISAGRSQAQLVLTYRLRQLYGLFQENGSIRGNASSSRSGVGWTGLLNNKSREDQVRESLSIRGLDDLNLRSMFQAANRSISRPGPSGASPSKRC